ncbi:hypothetical protein EF53_232 [Enterococcus phage 53]|uniref:Uncharacterized protein n=1 Tax=Enterococcus phage vB_Efs6_KEN16 TaxID=3138325 RepID=A0AAX4PUD3_9CAUD|nr:hypothetical protein EF53_232 [Enterococcus phage 53]
MESRWDVRRCHVSTYSGIGNYRFALFYILFNGYLLIANFQ